MSLEEKIGYSFQDVSTLELAASHSSLVNERKLSPVCSNERLEFLGDAVLELVVSSYLYENYPELLEGEMTKLRAAVVCEPSLAKRANALALFDDLQTGRGEDATGGKRRDSVLSDFFEAIIGAIYVDGGFVPAQTFILRELEPEIKYMRPRFSLSDAKTALQEQLQKSGPAVIEYKTVSEFGPDHEKTFVVNVIFERRIMGTGQGKNKKEAEQNAAAQALSKIRR